MFKAFYTSLEFHNAIRLSEGGSRAYNDDRLAHFFQQREMNEWLFIPESRFIELYVNLNGQQGLPDEFNEVLLKQVSQLIPNGESNAGSFEKYFNCVEGKDAVVRFFRSALGWLTDDANDSGQAQALRKAHAQAKQSDHVGVVINRLYQRALWLHEKIRLETDFFDHSVSLAHAISELAGKIFGKLKQGSILIIGTTNEAINISRTLNESGIGKLSFVENDSRHEKIFSKAIRDAAPIPAQPEALQLLAPDLILVFDNSFSQIANKQFLQTLMSNRQNSPLMLVDLSGFAAQSVDLQKMYNLFLFGREDLNRIIRQNQQSRRETEQKIEQWIEAEVAHFFQWLDSNEQYHFGAMVGSSSQMQNVFELIARTARTDITILIQGESGTGKELVARAVHEESSRAEKPFVVVNCGAIPENLIESELFGHVRGAFTGAVKDKKGLLEDADGGTIFLDEIGELSQTLQVKLLRFLQEGEIKSVGSNTTIKLDVRVIAATNRNLLEMVEQGSFRSDLYYRLNVIPIDLPPLRERYEDIPFLTEHFLDKYAVRMRKPARKISEEAIQKLIAYHWPGNIRELENAIERAVALSTDFEIGMIDLPERIQNHTRRPMNHKGRLPLKEIERQYIVDTLEYCCGNQDEAARVLGIGRTTLWRKLKEYQAEA